MLKPINPTLGILRELVALERRMDTARLQNIRIKAIVLGLIALATALPFWHFVKSSITLTTPMGYGNGISLWAGLPILIAPFVVFGMFQLMSKKPALSPYVSPLYAVFIGVMFGGYSGIAEFAHPGLAVHASVTTLCTYIGLLFAYKTRLIKVDKRFTRAVTGLMSAMVFTIAVDTSLSILVGSWIALFSMPAGVQVFNLVMLVLGAMALMLDFDFMETCVHEKAGRDMEWYASASLLTSVLWIFLAILFLFGRRD